MKALKFLIIIAVIGIAATAGQDLIINTGRLDGFLYGNKSGGVDTLIVADNDSLGQFQIKNVKDPAGPLDAVNYRTLLAGGGAGLDSIPFNLLSGDLNAYFGGVNFYTTNLDGRYIEYADTASLVVTESQLNDSLSAVYSEIQDASSSAAYSFALPVAGTLAGSIAAMTSGDNPNGWTFTASGTNIEIHHNFNKYVAAVSVQYNSGGTAYRQLVNFQTAYNTFENTDLDNTTVISISNFYTQYKLRVYLIFN